MSTAEQTQSLSLQDYIRIYERDGAKEFAENNLMPNFSKPISDLFSILDDQ